MLKPPSPRTRIRSSANASGQSKNRRRARPASDVGGTLLPSIIDAIPVLAWTARADGSVDYFNRQWLAFTGMRESEALGWGWIAAIYPEDRDRCVESWRSKVALGEPIEIEARLRRHDGNHLWFLIRANALSRNRSRVSRWCGTNTEIDIRKAAEAAIRASESSYRMIVDSVPALLFTVTVAGEVEYVNPPLLECLGRPLQELQDQWRFSEVIHPEDRQRVIDACRRGFGSGQPFSFEERLLDADGRYRWFIWRGVPHYDANGMMTRWFGSLTETDELKRTEAALRGMQSRLARAAHFAAVSELSASIAHEINQPLAAVVANGQALGRWLASDPPNIERAVVSVNRIIRDGKSAGEIVLRIRSLFRQAPLIKEPIDVNQLMLEVLLLVDDDLKRGAITLRTELSSDLPPVHADRVQMQQVVMNLLRNGVEAMEETSDRLKLLAIATRLERREVVVEVSDHGVGLTDTDAIFDAFYTTKEHGMGMGLSITRSIVEAHGGRLWAARNEPCGATFSFSLLAEQ
jgi:PAS domain S-box-containing protein